MDAWLLSWEQIYADAQEFGLAEVQGERPLYDFLEAIRPHEEVVATVEYCSLMHGNYNKDLPALIKRFRDLRRMRGPAYIYSVRPALQGRQRAPDCFCGKKHYYAKCYYVVDSPRPVGWKPDPAVQQLFRDRIKNPRFASQIEKARRSAARKAATAASP